MITKVTRAIQIWQFAKFSMYDLGYLSGLRWGCEPNKAECDFIDLLIQLGQARISMEVD